MNKNILVPVVALGVIVLAGGGYLLTKDSDNDSDNSQATSESTQNKQQANTNDSSATSQNDTSNSSSDTSNTESTDTTITYSDEGFSPSKLTVKSGTTVTIKNTSGSSVQFQSDPHPSHTDDPELNVGVVAAGASATFKVTTMGSHGYHNHFDSSQTGTLVVN